MVRAFQEAIYANLDRVGNRQAWPSFLTCLVTCLVSGLVGGLLTLPLAGGQPQSASEPKKAEKGSDRQDAKASPNSPQNADEAKPSNDAKKPDGTKKADDSKKDEKAKGDDKAPPDDEPVRFLRVRRDERKTVLALETSITRYVPKDPSRPAVVVDLVAVVHIGERSYYDELNKRFADYDAVLYELVAPEGTRVPKGGGKGGGTHPVSAMQNGMKTMLGLEFQLERVDYTPRHFIHADMTPEEMSKSMSDRQESWSQMFLRMIGQGIAQQAKQQQQGTNGDLALLAALFAKDRTVRLKRILATQFEDMDASLAALEGPDGSTLITQRNKKALQVLDRELKAGKRRVAVFYGAGHMVDMEQRLLADFGLQRSEESWLMAWSMEPAK